MGASSFGARPKPLAPVPARTLATLVREPTTWTVSLLFLTGITVLARHPLARMIGTETDVPVAGTPVATAPAVTGISSGSAPSALAGGVAIPTHAPRDPFRALVAADGRVLAPVSMTTTSAHPSAAPGTGSPAAPTTSATAAGASVAGACTGTSIHVVAGDTLWGLAARATRSTDSGRVTVAWHRLYAANRAVLGSDPSLLQVGETLCVPAGI